MTADKLLTPALTVFEQMALDEWLASHQPSRPLLRFYHWTAGEAVTFGYAQGARSVRTQTPPHVPICRRPTGGGMVRHGADLTFSFIFPSRVLRPKDIYFQLHSAVEQALLQTDLLTATRQGAVAPQAYAPMQQGAAAGCFACPVEDDLLADGRKILGGALRRFGPVVLYQGSLQCERARTDTAFRRAVEQAASHMSGCRFATRMIDEQELAAARQLARRQYETDEWNQKFL